MAFRLSTGLVATMLATSSLKAALEGSAGFLIDIYSGTQPANPDTAPTGTLLVTVSLNGAGTGMHFETAAVSGALPKKASETWSATAVATGTAGWFRIRTTTDTGTEASTTASRVDGAIATSGGEMTLGSLTVTSGAPFVMSAGSVTLPTA